MTSSVSPAGEASERTHPPRSVHTSLPAEEFKALFRAHPGGVAVITADAGNGPVALTATSVASVSADPPLLVFSVSALSSATPTIVAAETIVVHLLDADDIDLARLGATSGVDRFEDREIWSRLVSGEPVFHGARAWVRCVVINRMEAGGSTVIAAQAIQASVGREDEPGVAGNALVYHNRRWHRLGEHSILP